jgi:hypothetical protein
MTRLDVSKGRMCACSHRGDRSRRTEDVREGNARPWEEFDALQVPIEEMYPYGRIGWSEKCKCMGRWVR